MQDLAVVAAAEGLPPLSPPRRQGGRIGLEAADQFAVEEAIAQRLDGLADLSPQVLAHPDPGGEGVLVEPLQGQEPPLAPPRPQGERDEAAGVAQAIQGAKVAIVARLKDGLQVKLDVALGEGVMIVAQEAQQHAISQHGPQVGRASVEEGLEHVVG